MNYRLYAEISNAHANDCVTWLDRLLFIICVGMQAIGIGLLIM